MSDVGFYTSTAIEQSRDVIKNTMGSRPPSSSSRPGRQPLASIIASDGNSSDGNAIQPIVVNSEKELEMEFESLRDMLKDKKNDWKARCDALKRLQALLYGGACEFDCFLTLLHGMKESIATQLGELRSSIVREACHTVNVLSKLLGDKFESFGDYFMPCLFKLVVVTIQVMSDSGNHCVHTMIKHSRLSKSIPLILETVSSKKTHGSLRTRCAEYMLVLLEEPSQTNVERYCDQFASTIQTCLGDGLAQVRASARQCYWAFSKHWPDRASKLFAALDSTTQKHISKDEPAKRASSESVTRPKSAASSKTRVAISNLKKKAAKAASKMDDFISPTTPSGYPETNNFEMDLSDTIRSNSSTNSGSLRSEQSSSSKVRKEPTSQLSAAPMRAKSAGKNILVPSTKSFQALNSTGAPTKAMDDSARQRQPTLHQDSFNNHLVPANRPSRLVPADTSSLSRATSSSSIASQDSDRMTDICEEEPQSSFVDQNFSVIIRECSNQDWNIRVKCLESIVVICRSDRKGELSANFDKIMSVLLERVMDTHYRVVNRALLCMVCLISEFTQHFEIYLERVFSKILLKLTDPKEKVRKLTENVLLEVGNNYTAENLLPILFKVLDNSNSKVQLACLEYILHIVPNSAAYLSHPSHMRMAITKLNTVLSNKKSGRSCEAAALALLLSLYKTHIRLFLEQILLLPINEQLSLKGLLETKIPDLESELASVSKQKASTRRASTGARSPDSHSSKSARRASSETTIESAPPTVAPTEPEIMNDGLLMIPSRVLEKIQRRANSQVPPSSNQSAPKDYNPQAYEKKHNEPKKKALDEIADMLNQINYNCIVSRAFEEACKSIRRLTELIRVPENVDVIGYVFAKLLFKVLELINNEDSGVRSCSLYMLQALLQYHISQFESFADITLKKIMSKYTDPSVEVFRAAVEVSETFVDNVDPLRTIEALKSMIVSNLTVNRQNSTLGALDGGAKPYDPRDAILLGSIKLMSKIVSSQRLTIDTLNPIIPSILPGLADSMNHSNADIRKAVVYCLVDLFDKLGPSFRTYLSTSLTESQIKLVTVYLKERKNRALK